VTQTTMPSTVVSFPDVISSETDRLDPVPEFVELGSGTRVRVLSLKMRQLFRLLRIVTRGGAQYLPLLRDAMLTAEENSAEAFGTQLMAIAMIALPEAEDEAVAFVQSVVEPADLHARNDKQSRELNEQLRIALDAELDNPDLNDLVTILETVINREKADLVALGKRLRAMFSVALKTGQVPDVPSPHGSSEPTRQSPEPSLVPVISSPPSTDGLTTSSSTSPSVE
jgi:hypothetical protein